MIEKRKFAETIFLCVLFVTITLIPFWVKVTRAQQKNTDQLLSPSDDISISYTNSSFTIESVSQYGNFSFTFEWANTGTYITYNGTLRPIKELKSIAFTDKTAKYRMEYWVPIMLYEYIDVDGNNLLNDTEHIIPDTLVAGYKINTNIGMTNITIIEDVNGTPACEWTYTQIAMPMREVHPPLEIYPIVKEDFHYYPLNGTLKMDIILQNFKPENASSRIFLSYGVRYVSLEQGNATVTVAFDGQELAYNQIDKAYPTTSNIVVFKVNGVNRGFFDFGGKVTIDNNPDMHVDGSVGPTRSWYYYQTDGKWLEIGLNYPHVNQTLIHDPYFGLYSRSLTAVTFPFEVTVTTAVISVIICTVATVDYFKTKNRYLKSTIRP
jgi:hypothetical protein